MKTVKVGNGNVQGQVKNILGNEVVEFLSIPYCKPPINELRFKKPQPCDTFTDDIINKLTFETYPPQGLFSFKFDESVEYALKPKGKPDENSLYANVWCPLNILNGKEKKPVLVWIYGGGFIGGSSSIDIYDGAILASQENIIVVSFNYRVAMLGFVCLDEEEMNGNLGIWDQVCALRWIHNNIAHFNGDPENITICGNSAGGCSVSLHLIIEESWPYFNKAISESGVCFSTWGLLSKDEIVRRSRINVNKILDKFHFKLKWDEHTPKKDKAEIIRFLQQLNFTEFLNEGEITNGMAQFSWAPLIDGELIKEDPRILFSKEHFKKCPTIFLNSENEGCSFRFMKFLIIEEDNENMIDIKYFNDIAQYYPHFPKKCPDPIKEEIKKEYNIKDKLSLKVLDKIIGDEHFVCDIIEMANVVSESNREVYYLWNRNAISIPGFPEFKDAMHGSEVFYIFGNPFKEYVNGKEEDKEASKVYMSQFGKFIKHGRLDKDLPYYNQELRTFISITGINWQKELFSDHQYRKVEFWRNLRKKCTLKN